MSWLYSRTSEQKKLSGVMFMFSIIWSLDGNVINKEAVLVMMLFNNLSNNFNSIHKVGFVGILYFDINTILMK